MKRSFVFVALALFVFSLSQRTLAAADDQWISVKSKNFSLIGNAAEKDIRLVATKLEQFRETFRIIFPGLKVDSSIRTTVIVFKSSSSYRPFKPRRPDGKPDDGIAGYFQPGDDINYITLSIDGNGVQDSLGTIFHEYTHFMLDTSIGKANIPVWFNEGMAEYYQTYKIVDDQKVTLGSIQNNHLMLLNRARLIPLNQFFAVDSRSLHSSGDAARDVFYAQAWAFMHYLMQGNGGSNADKLQRFLNLLLKETPPEAAFKQVFNSDYATVERELREYVEKSRFTASLITLPNKLTYDTALSVAPLSQGDANAHLGDLLLHIRAFADAEAQLQKTLAMDPAHSMANASLGLVKMRQRNFPEAKKYLERAVAADKNSHYAHYNYAFVLSREAVDEFGYIQKFAPDSVKKMRAALTRAIELDPKFAESYRLLAFIGLVNDELEDAEKNVAQALTIQPGDPDYMLLAAKIYLRQEKYDNARTIAERVAKTTDEKDVKAEADSLLKSIQQIAESKAAYERQVAETRKALEAQGLQLRPPNAKPPVILQRKDLTDEQVAQFERDRENANINRLIPRPRQGEARVLGNIESITCPDGEVRFNVRTADGKLVLSALDFQSLHLSIFKEGTQNFEIGCGASLSGETLVVTYKLPQKPISGISGEMIAGAFVPAHFRLMSEEELANMPLVIIEGGPPTDLSKNAQQAAAQQADFDQKRREMIIRQIRQALREPQTGEQRLTGTVEKVECSGRTMSAIVTTDKGPMKFNVTSAQALHLMVFTPDVPSMRFGCGEAFPNVKAVVTYAPASDKKFAGELKSVEFVPSSFSLN